MSSHLTFSANALIRRGKRPHGGVLPACRHDVLAAGSLQGAGLKKEQDMAWKYKEEHLNAVKEYLLNLDNEMKHETKQETKQETGQETKQGTRQVIKQETRQETRQESSVIG